MHCGSCVNAFLSKYNFQPHGPSINGVISSLLFDMSSGLESYPSKNVQAVGIESSMDMIPTWMSPPLESIKNTSVIIIDAGGTNFRSGLVTFDSEGHASISDMFKTTMPATDREYSKEEFFSTIASYLDHLKNKATRIGFCFSYAMDITPSGDGRVLRFSKEIKAKEVIGSLVGECLTKALEQRGWTSIEKIVLLNDTAAALLSGATTAVKGKRYGSFVGFILGTGMNAAYIEYTPIQKIAASEHTIPASQIVVCESGKSNKIASSDFDKSLDASTATPGFNIYEKMCSGAYLGSLTLLVLQQASKDCLFSPATAESILSLGTLELIDINTFLHSSSEKKSPFSQLISKATEDDEEKIYLLCDAIVERAARLTAANIASVIIKSGKGHSPLKPVCVLCEGTTLLKTHLLKDRVHQYLLEILTEERSLWFELVTLENAVTLGSAVAACTVQ